MSSPTAYPEPFAKAVAGLRAATPRAEILLEEVAAPQRLAPYAFAMSGTVLRDGEEVATGRLVLLYDPAGHEAWDGTMRLVTFVTAELETDLAADVLLPDVGWTWLTDALETEGAAHTALGGTVTQTLSTRFGDLAGPPPAADIEIRASWTPVDDSPSPLTAGCPDMTAHLLAWCAVLSSTAGLPPPGVTLLHERPLGAA